MAQMMRGQENESEQTQLSNESMASKPDQHTSGHDKLCDSVHSQMLNSEIAAKNIASISMQEGRRCLSMQERSTKSHDFPGSKLDWFNSVAIHIIGEILNLIAIFIAILLVISFCYISWIISSTSLFFMYTKRKYNLYEGDTNFRFDELDYHFSDIACIMLFGGCINHNFANKITNVIIPTPIVFI